MKCQTPFFIWFHHRSGSTHLCSLLDSHPLVTCWGEFFYRGEGDASGDLFTRSEQSSVAGFLDSYYEYRWDPDGTRLCVENPTPPYTTAVGFKLKYQQAKSYPETLQYLRANEGVKAIHLVRTNLVSALVSAAMIPRLIKKYQRPNLMNGESPGEVERRVELNPNTILEELAELETRIENARQAIRGIPTLEITYESLVSEGGETCRQVLDFLNVDPTADLDSRYVKIMPSLRQSLTNWEAIADVLRGTRYEPMLEEACQSHG